VSAPELLIAGLTVAVGACLQGAVGFGLSLLAVPILLLVDPSLVPVPLIVASLTINVGSSYRNRGGIDGAVRWALLGSMPGTVLGAYAIAVLPQRPLAITLGVLVLAAVAVSASGLEVAPTTGSLLAAGAISGFTGTASSIGGPPARADVPAGARLHRARHPGVVLPGRLGALAGRPGAVRQARH
jgi:uncharacterized membrane protein YfcA